MPLRAGINDVVKSVVNTLEVGYDVKKISGVRYGFGGFYKDGVENLKLNRKSVRGIQTKGGSIVGCGWGWHLSRRGFLHSKHGSIDDSQHAPWPPI